MLKIPIIMWELSRPAIESRLNMADQEATLSATVDSDSKQYST